VTVPDPAHRLTPVVRLAPAKINLTLAVVGRRPDGYHDQHSVFVPLAIADRLSLAPLGVSGADTLHVSGPDTGPAADNLVLRGIGAARAAIGQGPGRPACPPLAARLEKRLPVAAGLGGGSSDGAAAFLGALEAWGIGEDLDPSRRMAAAATIGSDVPFFLAEGPALVEGRGERVTALTGPSGAVGVLLVTPRLAVRTPDVYAVFAGTHPEGRGDGAVRLTSEHLASELGRGLAPADLVARTGVLAAANDLLASAVLVEPRILVTRRALTRLTGRPIGLSGSGPTLWTLYPSLGEAQAAAHDVREAIRTGALPTEADGPPDVVATTIAMPPTPSRPSAEPQEQPQEDDPR
jgi:4-diphosphocytidyl-2-C-methyl-D-erythritol kinase